MTCIMRKHNSGRIHSGDDEYKRVLEDNDKLQKKIIDQGTQIQKLKEALQ